jgi:type IV pilus assembly protein PilA
MRKNKGFTLVELLVVMAIISILAAIAIPNIQSYIARGRATQAISEIQNIELAMTKLLSDAGRSSLNDLLNLEVIGDSVGINPANLKDVRDMTTWAAGDFENFTEAYTNAVYRLLKKGRSATVADDGSGIAVLNYQEDVVRNLGTSYFAELGFDPWGELYQVFPGPWRVTNGPNVFRVYLPATSAAKVVPGESTAVLNGDDLSLGSGSDSGFVITDIDGQEIEIAGVPASNQVDTYIWSKGANLVSGQAEFLPPVPGYNPGTPGSSQYGAITPITTAYPGGQEPELVGGGDDVNNWDRNQTFMRFYN